MKKVHFVKKKIPLLILAACIFLAVVFADTLPAASHDHDGIGSQCLICLIMEAGRHFIKAFNTGVLFAVFTFLTHLGKRNTGPGAYALSPVTLKVRYNS